MRTFIVALFLFSAAAAHAQFTPLCGPAATPAPCVGTMLPALLPLVPVSKGGTGNASPNADEVFYGLGAGNAGFRPLTKTAVSGASVDLSRTPGPIIEVRKDVGT